MFNEKFFNRAHPELIFINGARGKLVEERALREFLLSHPKAQAFLDVFEHEPFNESWHHFPQVWKTSHIAGVYSGLDEGVVQFEEKTLKDFIFLEEIDFFKKYSKELLQNKWVNGELI
jgi:phosphoglycerate dehydrogenase-like enzyme